MAKINDIMIIIGSFTSANSNRLTQLSLAINSQSFQVTDSKDLNPKWFKDKSGIGVSAGASTPDYLINDVKTTIEYIYKEKLWDKEPMKLKLA
jgi:4-hydroxy-3-methylbut-2-enyl diphosphate reductase